MVLDIMQQVEHVKCAEVKSDDHTLTLLHDYRHMRKGIVGQHYPDSGGSPLQGTPSSPCLLCA